MWVKIGFIGAGKVGNTLGQYFIQKQLDVGGYYSRRISTAVKGAERTNSKVFSKLEELIEQVDMIFITTADDAIAQVVNQIADTKLIRKEHILIHTSGVHSTDVFEQLVHVGCGVYSMHPLQSFADADSAVKRIHKTHFTIEGNGVHLCKITEMFEKINNPYYMIENKQKELYHAGACVISNYLVTLMSVGFDFIEASGFPKESIYSAFEPLIYSTLENIKDKGPEQSLTGPICRGDMETIKEHMQAIKNSNMELEFYKYMGLKTLGMLEKSNALDENKEAIKKMLVED